jgi:hypothetical protein
MSKSGHDPHTGVHALIDHAHLGGPAVDGSLHVDGDLICPRCLAWIAPDHYVRRTFTGVVEHEACPRPLEATGLDVEAKGA